MDADADRNPGVSVAVARLEEIPRGRDGAGRVILAGKAGDEERDRLVADELVHDPVPAIDDARGRAPETREQLAELTRGSRSARPVEPRTSANSAEISTSAPPGCLCADLRHQVQSRRFNGDGLPPKTRIRMFPGLPNGA